MIPSDENELSALSPSKLRFAEAEHFLNLFIKSCAPPKDWYFETISYADAFLFTLISVEEMVEDTVCQALRSKPVFRFLKAMRNVTTHHSVLASVAPGSKLPRPFSRHMVNDISARLCFRFDILRQIFDVVEKERPFEKKALDRARIFIAEKEAAVDKVYLEDVFFEGLNCVEPLIS
jgi:hypothetical protein